MEIRTPNCDACIHNEVCFQKSMLGSIVDDIKKTKRLNDKDYASLMTCFSMDFMCQHFCKHE